MPFNTSLELRLGRFHVLVVCCFFALLSACGGDNSVNTSQTRQVQGTDGGRAAGKSQGQGGGGAAGKSKITRLEITSKVSPAFAGRSFGDVGQYELLIGKIYGAADPDSPRNTSVTDLSGAPRNGAGLVEYSADVAILKPIDMGRANGTLIYEVVNRGRKLVLPPYQLNGDGSFDRATGVGPSGVGLEQGQVMVWSGWQGDMPSTANAAGGGNMAAQLPIATNVGGGSITGTVVQEFLLDGTAGAPPIPPTATSFDATLTYPPVAADVSNLTLTVQERADDAPVTQPSSQMAFIDAKTVRVQRAGGYDLGAIYRITYRAKDPIVLGLSFVSIRDLISFLRNDATDRSGNPNPLAIDGESAIQTTIGTGFSQSGQFVREFINLDFNKDERGRRVFDGMMAIGAGVSRGWFYQRFALPGAPGSLQHEGRAYPARQFPFTYPTLTDTVTGKTDGILLRCSRSHSCPKVMQLDNEWEQWQHAGSLLVTDTLGNPIQLPDTVRAYVAVGLQHGAMGSVASGKLPANAPYCENTGNPLSWAPIYRALMLDLEAWLVDEVLPPDNRNPATEAEGRVSIDTLAASYPAIPGYEFTKLYNKLKLVDFSTDPWTIILDPAPYPISFLRINADGNAYDGIVLPEVAVPIATYAGRTSRKDGYAKGDLCSTSGASFPFAKTVAERTATGDPRPSLEERYTSEADYREKLKAVADQLVEQRLMLPVDADAYNSFVLPH